LLHGRLVEALHDNVLFVTLLPVALAMLATLTARAWREDRWPAVHIPQRIFVSRGLGLFAVALLFMALRNLPGAPFDLLRPLS
jgi:drug/metabolite transporter (DMT)-like permease